MTCPIFVGSPAVSFINTGWDFVTQKANNAYLTAQQLAVDMTQFQVEQVSFSYTFDPPASPSGFIAPTPPSDPNLIYDPSGFHQPGDPPPTGDVGQINFIPIPAKDFGTPPTLLAQPPADQSLPTPDYGTAPNIPTSYVLPAVPTFNNPNDPSGSLLPIVLPNLPTINLPVFTAQAPIVDFDAPVNGINFTPQPYASTELTVIQAKLADMMNGNGGLPAAVEAALFSRARGREDVLAFKAIQEAREEYAANGFSMPPGSLDAKIKEIRQNAQNQAGSMSRDIYIENQKQALESMRLAVQQGIALEGKLMDFYMNLQQLELQAQKYMLDANVELFNAKVSLFNARNQAYATQAQVFRDLIQAELAKVEIYKAQIEGARLVEEINKDKIAIYEAQIRAVHLLIEEYNAQLEGVRIQVEVDKGRIDIFRARVQAYAEQVHAKEALWNIYKTQVEADASRVNLFNAQVQAFAAEVRAASDGNQNLIAQANLKLETQKTALLGWRGKLDRLIADMDAETKRLTAGVQVYEGKARIYSAAGQIAAAESDANTRTFQAIVEAGRASTEIAIENAKTKIQQNISVAQIMSELLKAATATMAQLAASAMSALRFGAEASDSNSTAQSSGCQTIYQISSSA